MNVLANLDVLEMLSMVAPKFYYYYSFAVEVL